MPFSIPPPTTTPFHLRARGIALLYALFAVIWITGSDWAAFELFRDTPHLSMAQTVKGYVFVAVTSVALLVLMSRSHHDLAARNRQLRENVLFTQSLIDASPLGIIVLDAHERVTLWSRGAEQVLGWRQEETLGQQPEPLEGHRYDLRPWLERVSRGETVASFETVRQHKAGHEVDVSISGAPLYGAEGHVTGSVALLMDISERVRAQNLLRASEERLRAVFDTTETSFLLVNLRREIVMFNRRAAELFDQIYGRTLAFGESMDDVVAAAHLEENRTLFEEARSGVLVSRHAEVAGRNKTFFLDVRVAPVYDQDGAVAGVLFNSTDVTELHEAERARRETDIRFESLFNSVEDVIVVHEFSHHSRRSRIIQVNDAACATLKYDREELLSMTIEEIYRADPEYVDHGVQRLGATGATAGQACVVAKDGDLIPVEFKAHRIDLDGRSAVINACRDIRHRLQMEAALRNSEAEYRMLFRANPRPMWVYDLENYRFMRVNRAAVAHYGYSEEEFLAMSIFDIRPDDQKENLLENIQRDRPALEQSGPWLHQKKDGSLIEVEIGSHTLEIDGRPAVLVLVQDVTERNRLTREIERYNAALRSMSVRLLETQEIERRRIARELHDEAGARLTSLQMCLAMARETVADASPASAAEIREAQDLTRELADMVRQLSMNLRPGVLDDLGLVPAIEWFIGRYQRQTGVDVSFYHELFQGERLPAEIETSAYRIAQESLTNIARHSGSTRASVMLNRTDGELRLHIVDEGRGFDPVRPDGSDSVGIASMRERAQLIGGKVEISSAPGKGTRVSATLPIAVSGGP